MSQSHRPKRPPKPPRRLVTIYEYRDERGKLLHQVLRYDPKEFSSRRPTRNGKWSANLQRVRRVPYRLPELLAASSSEPVFIVEGEKDVDRLWSVGLVATCNSGGGGQGKWPRSHRRFLQGRDVIILPDNDTTGDEHALDVAQKLHGYAKSIRIIELPGLPYKGDVSDWLDAGGTPGELKKLVAAAPFWSLPRQRPRLDLAEGIMEHYPISDILVSDLTAQQKLLMLILSLKIKQPLLTLKVLSQYMSLTVRRVKQIKATLRKAGLVETLRAKQLVFYRAAATKLSLAGGCRE
jgi:hypothetical protein